MGSGDYLSRHAVGRSLLTGFWLGIGLVMATGSILLGWSVGSDLLTRVYPGWPATHPLTATGFLLVGLALVLDTAPPLLMKQLPAAIRRHRTRLSQTAALLALCLAGTQVVLYAFDAPVKLDEWLFPGLSSSSAVHPSRMSLLTAIMLTLLSSVYLLQFVRRETVDWIGHILLVVAGVVALLSLIGHVIKAQFFYGYFTAIYTSLLALVSMVGIFSHRPDYGLVQIIQSRGVAAILLKWLLPAGMILPIILGSVDIFLLTHTSLRHESTVYAQVAIATLLTLAAILLAARRTWLMERAAEQAGIALRQREEHLDVTLRSIGDAVLTTDMEGRVTRLNPVAEALTGWPEGEALGRQVEEVFNILNEESREPVTNPVGSVLKTGVRQGLANHTALLARNGQEVAIADSAAPIRDHAGDITGVVLVFRDVSEDRQAELALKQERWRLGNVIRATNIGTWEWNVQTGETRFNERWAEITGHTLNELAPHTINTWLERTEPDDRLKSKQLLQRHFAGELEFFESETRMQHKDGHWVWVVDTGKVFSWTDDGEPLMMYGTHRDITARKQAELDLQRLNSELELRVEERTAALSESEARFRTAMQHSAIGMALVEPGGRMLDVNEALCSIVGYTREELSGQTLQSITYQDDLEVGMKQVKQLLDGRSESYQIEKRYVHKQGRAVWVLLSVTMVRHTDGTPQHFIAQIQDITSRKQVEQAMQVVSSDLVALDGQAYYEAAANSLADIVDADIVFISRIDSEAPARLSTVVLVEDGRVQANIRYAMAGTPCAEVIAGHTRIIGREVMQQYPEDKYFKVKGIQAYAATPLLDTNGHVQGHIGVMRKAPLPGDTSIYQVLKSFGLAVATQIMRERSRRQYQDLFEFAPDAIVMTNAKGLVVMANRQAEILLGWRRDDLIGEPVEVLIPTQMQGRHPGLRKHYLETATPRVMGGEVADLQAQRKDGSTFPVDISLSPVDSEDGMMIAASIRDISERRRAEDEIRALNADLEVRVEERTTALQDANRQLEKARKDAEGASRAKSAFLATMSHEIRTPMNGVVGMLDVLAHSKLSEQQGDAVRTIRESSFTLLRLIDDILDFSKIEAGRLELERVPVSVTPILEGVCSTLTPLADDKGVDIFLFIDPRVPGAFWSDPTRLRQIMYNLIGNAIKFSGDMTGTRGRVLVRVEPHADVPQNLSISVADNGIGMTVETLGRLFTTFSQGEASTTRRFGGTGLGLVICQRLANMMRGEITVVSTPNEGSTFTVVLPVEAVPDTEERPFEALPGVQCIVVESRDYRAEDVAAYLAHAGAHVQMADDVESAMQLAAKQPAITVIVHGTDKRTLPAQGRLKTSTSPVDVRFLIISRGQRRQARVSSEEMVSIDGRVLSRSTLLRAAAVASGLASPEVFYAEKKGASAAGAIAPPTVAEARAQGRLILVAEDDMINQKVILQQLALIGHAGEVANNGVEALRLWRKGGYALVLSDLHMPEMDGYGLTEAIRQEEDGHIPIIALTANALRGEAARAKAIGMDAYLTKPVQLDVLKSELEKWLPHTDAGKPASPAPGKEDPGAGEMEAQVVDVAVLRHLVGNNEAIIKELLGDYLKAMGSQFAELRTAIDENNLQHAAALVHKLKSSSRSVGAMAFGDMCADMESAAKAGDRQAIEKGLIRFDKGHAAVEKEVRQLLE